MRILIVYATTDGQTEKIARFCTDHLTAAGHSVQMTPATRAMDIDPAAFDAAILAGSLHAGGFQRPLLRFARTHAAALSRLPGLFLPVSLSAAGHDARDWAGLASCTDRFLAETGWQPSRISHVAGAFRFSRYGLLRAFAMRRIARQKDSGLFPGQDREYTDWPALAAALDAFAPAA